MLTYVSLSKKVGDRYIKIDPEELNKRTYAVTPFNADVVNPKVGDLITSKN